MFYFNVLNELDHAELLTSCVPRPMMVESGLLDEATPKPWVDGEFARARMVYESAGVEGDIVLEHFPGPHRIWSEGSFTFLRRVLER